MKRTLSSLAALTALGITSPAQADSFLPPAVQEAQSLDGSIVVTVIPAMLSCAPEEIACEPAARAIVERLRGENRSNSRTIRLINPQAPGQVLVTDDGERLLTVDDYASYGMGDNVLVIYGSEGEVIARLGLDDFLPEDYIAGLPRTVSTLRWWAEPVRIEAGSHRAIVSVKEVHAGDNWAASNGSGFELSLDLDTGEIDRPAGARWDKAFNCARANTWLVPDRAAEPERERFRALCR